MITTAYIIYCSTGCSCCNNENHYRGPFSSKAAADAAVTQFKAMPLLASQYSAKGNYTIEEVECEHLPDTRLIINNHWVCAKFVDDVATSDEAIYN